MKPFTPTLLTFILISISCCLQIAGFSQNSKTNGYQKVFLDNNLNKADSSEACFWGYEYYNDGNIIAEKFPPSHLYKNCTLVFEGSLPAKGSPGELNGVFKWIYNDSGETVNEYTFKNGHTLLAKEFLGGDVRLLIDFTKKYNGEEGSCYFTDYVSYTFSSDKRKKTTCYWYRKTENKWKRIKTPCE